MKKIFLFFCAICSTIVAIACNTQVDGIWYNFDSITLTASVTYPESADISYSNEYSEAVVIPDIVTYNGRTYSVTSIGDYAFQGCSNLTSVEIPNSVTSIGDYAFNDCICLSYVTIHNSVTTIGDYAFYNCLNLKTVYNGSSHHITRGSTDYGYVAYYANHVFLLMWTPW